MNNIWLHFNDRLCYQESVSAISRSRGWTTPLTVIDDYKQDLAFCLCVCGQIWQTVEENCIWQKPASGKKQILFSIMTSNIEKLVAIQHVLALCEDFLGSALLVALFAAPWNFFSDERVSWNEIFFIAEMLYRSSWTFKVMLYCESPAAVMLVVKSCHRVTVLKTAGGGGLFGPSCRSGGDLRFRLSGHMYCISTECKLFHYISGG